MDSGRYEVFKPLNFFFQIISLLSPLNIFRQDQRNEGNYRSKKKQYIYTLSEGKN